MKRILLAFVLLASAGCHSETDFVHAVQAQGFRGVYLTGYAWVGCGRDGYGHHFVGINPAGSEVQGTVCCGLAFKGCTVRF